MQKPMQQAATGLGRTHPERAQILPHVRGGGFPRPHTVARDRRPPFDGRGSQKTVVVNVTRAALLDRLEGDVPDTVRARVAFAIVRRAVMDIGSPVRGVDSTEWFYGPHAANMIRAAGLEASVVYQELFAVGLLDMHTTIHRLLRGLRGER